MTPQQLYDIAITVERMQVALAKLICPACEHELQHHVDVIDGCEVERGDHEGGEGDYGPYPAYAMPPCGCNDADLRDDYPDFLRALEAYRSAKQ